MLQLSGIKKNFGPVTVLRGVDLEVRAGEVHALLGENGAGKSTLMKILCGIVRPDAGEIRIDGQPCRFDSYRAAIAGGVGVVFQEFSLIPYLDAVDNMFLARELRSRWGWLQRAAMRQRAQQIIAQLGVAIPLDVPVCKLSVAQQQFVEIAKALALEARILVLDEPTATLTPAEVEHLFAVMRSLRAQGVAIIFISHHLEEIFEICDRITVLRDGAYVATCATAEVDQARLVEMMVGRRIENCFPPKLASRGDGHGDGEVVLEVHGLQLRRQAPVSQFQLRRGEILGFAGLVGSGRTETVLAMLGAHPAQSCKLSMHGVPLRFADPAQALQAGIGLLPESRKEQGLITSFSILHNGLAEQLRQVSPGRPVPRPPARAAGHAGRHAARAGQGPGAQVRVDTLSGGNQQKVVIARWINHAMKVLIFDEPTRGIDVGAKAEIYQLMREFTAQGYSILMISSELPEVVGLADRVCVFRGGGIVATLEGEAVNAEEIMTHATSGRIRHAA